YLAFAVASASTLHAQSAPQAPEAGKTEAPASSPSTPAQAPSAQPGTTPSSPAPADKQEAPATKSTDAPLPPGTIYPPQTKPQRPVVQSRESMPAPVPVTERAKAKRTTHATRTGTVRATTPGIPVSANSVANAIAAAWPASQSQSGKTGQSGVYQ